ncbi:MAG: filamentous hemagglutinin N-terminal domain-containing protein [Pseudomonadota bacterium]
MTRPTTISKIALLGAVSSAALLSMGQAHAQLGTPTVLVGTGSSVATPDPGDAGRNLRQTITQGSSRLILQWDSMDIASDQSVIFDQAASSNIAVNRVIGGSLDGTTIDGVLSANGNVWIIDPNGITFGANADVDVNGLLATTADFADINDPVPGGFIGENANFVIGDGLILVFDVPGAPGATIDTTALDVGNVDGGISTGDGGVKFIAEGINHSGLIETTAVGVVELVGSVGDGSEVFTLAVDASNGAGLVQVPVSTDASTVALAGRIAATGGSVRITAAGTAAAIQNVVSTGAVIEADTITMQSDGTISLTNAANDFSGSIDASGTAITLVDTNAIELGDIDSTGSLTVTAGGAITDGAGVAAGSDINVATTTTLSSSAAVELNDGTNDFGGAFSASGTSVTLADANDIELADIDTAGTLTVRALGGAITDGVAVGAGSDINAGAADLAATAGVTLNDNTHDFTGPVSVVAPSVVLTDANDIELGDIDTAGTLTVTAVTGSITDGAQVGAGDDVNAGGLVNLSAGAAITLDDQTNDFGAGINASATSVTLSDTNSVELGDIDTPGALTVTAVSGSITDGSASGIGGDINSVGANLTAGADITIDDATNVIGGSFAASGTNVVLDFDGAAPTIAGIVAGGNLSLEVDGNLTGGPFDVTGTSQLTSNNGSIVLTDSANNSFGGLVTANAENAITILTDGALSANATAQSAGGIDAGNVVTLTADGNLTASALGNEIILTGSNVSLGAVDALEDAANSGGDLTVTATGAAGTIDGAAAGDILAQGTSTLAGPGGVSLIDATNDFVGDVSVAAAASSGAISLVDANDLTITSLTIGSGLANDLSLTAGGTLTTAAIVANDVTLVASTISTPSVTTQNGGTLVFTSDDSINGASFAFNIAGDSTFTSNNGSITLEDATDIFAGSLFAAAPSTSGSVTIDLPGDRTIAAQAGSAGSTTVSNTVNVTAGGMLTITEALGNSVTVQGTDLTLFDLDVEGDLVAIATVGGIGDDTATSAGSDVDVIGTSSFTAVTDIVLDDATNDFGGEVTATSVNSGITIADANALTLIARAGTLGAITSANAISATAGGALTLTEASGFTVDAAGASVSLGAINAEQDGALSGGNLVVVANSGSIDDDAAGDVSVANDASFTALTDGTSIIIDEGTTAIGGTLTANGHDVTFDFTGSIPTISSIIASGALNLEADGTLSGGFLDVAETANLTSNTGSIAFTDSANNSFGGLVTAVAEGGIDLRSDSAMNIAATAQAAGGTDASNIVTLISQSDLTASAIGNTVNLAGTSVVLDQVSVLETAGNTGGALTVLATNTIADTGTGAVRVDGLANLVGPAGVALDSASNDFVGAVTVSATSPAGAINLVDANDLTVTSATAGTGGALTSSNTLNLTTGGLLNVVSAQARDVTLTGGTVTLGDVSALLDTSASGGGLAVVANTGSITDVATVVAEGDTDLTAQDSVIVDDVSTDFAGVVSAVATDGSIVLVDVNALTAGARAGTPGSVTSANTVTLQAGSDLTVTDALGYTVSALGDAVSLGAVAAEQDGASTGGTLSVVAFGASIDDDAAGDLTIEGDTDFAAFDSVLIDDLTHDFQGAVSAFGSTVSLGDANDIALADIDAGSLTVQSAGGSITDGSASGAGNGLDVVGTATFIANQTSSSIVIDDTANMIGEVVATGHDITFDGVGSQLFGQVDATGDVALTADGGLSGGPLNIAGTTDLTSSAGSISFVDSANSFGGLVTADADGSIDLSGGSSGLTIASTSGGATTLDAASIAITSLEAASLDAAAAGDITGGSAVVTGLTELTSTSGVINLTGNDFQGQVTASAESASGAITLVDTDSLDVIATAGTAGALTAANTVDVTAADALFVGGTANDFVATARVVILNGVNALADTLAGGGDLLVTAIDGIGDSDQSLIEGTTTLATTNGGIDLTDSGGNDFVGLVTATNTNGPIDITDTNDLSIVMEAGNRAQARANGILTASAAGSSVVLVGEEVVLNDIDTPGNLNATASLGDLTDGAETALGGDIDVGGDAFLFAAGALTLDDLTNNFAGNVDAGGTTIALGDVDGIALADVDTVGDLTVTVATGSITDGVATLFGGDLIVDGDALFTVLTPAAGSEINIDDPDNRFGGLVSASGFDVNLGFGDAQVLGPITALNDLSVTAAGDLSGGPLVVTGTSNLASTAGSVTFTDAANSFGDQVTANATGAITLADVGDLDVVADAGGAVTLSAGGALTASSNGTVTTLSGDTIEIVSATASSLEATANGAIAGGSASVSGTTMLTSLTDAIMLAGNAFVGRVTAIAAGAIEITQAGDLSVDAAGDALTLSSDGLLSTTATGSSVNLTGGSVGIETVTASQSLTVVADDAITGGVVDVVTSTSLTAGGDIDLASTDNQFGADLSASGANITLGSMGALVLGMIDAVGNFVGITDGDITGGTTPVRVAGTTDLTAGGAVILNNTANDFGGGVSATGTSIEIADANSLALGDITTDGTLRIVFDADRATAPDEGVQLTDAEGTTIAVGGATDISTGLDAGATILSDNGGPSINLDNATHRFAGGLALRRIGGSAFVSEAPDASEEALILRNLEVGGDLTVQTGRSMILVGRLTSEPDGVFGLDPRLSSGQSNAAFVAEQGTDGLDEASFHLFIPDGATWTFDTTGGGASAVGADIRIDRPVDSIGSLALSVDDIAARQDNATSTGSLSLSAGTTGEVRFRDFVGANRPLGLVRVLTAGSAFIGSTRATSPVNEDEDAFLMARSANPVSNADLNLRDFFYAASLSFEDVTGNAQVLVPEVHATNGFEFFGLNVSGGDGSFDGGPLNGRGISGFAFAGDPDFLEVFGGIAPSGGDIIRGASAGLVADGINISARTTFNGCQVGDTSTCINIDIPVVVTAPQNTLTVDTVGMDDPNDSNFLAFGNEQLWANPPTFFILAPLPAAATEE